MDCLEFNLEQLILTDLARNIGSDISGEPSVDAAIELVSSGVETRDVGSEQELADGNEQRVFMPASRVHCNIGFGELAVNLPESHVDTTVPVLIDILNDISFIDFDTVLPKQDWALPDQLAYSTVSALLNLSIKYNQYRNQCIEAICSFLSKTVTHMSQAPRGRVLTQTAPAFHGLYRAIISTSFPWTIDEWYTLSASLNILFAEDLVERLNNLLLESAEDEPFGRTVTPAENGDDLGQQEFPLFQRTLLARYIANGRPLTGYFVVCCVIEIQWTVLSQTLITPPPQTKQRNALPEAAAANRAWLALMRSRVKQSASVDSVHRSALRTTLDSATQVFTDLLLQIEDMDGDPSMDTYAWETMSESLKLASVCSVAISELDQSVYTRLQLLLSEDSPIFDNLVQEAALKSMTVLVQNFPTAASHMAAHMRRFVTSPLPMFEFQFTTDTQAPPPLSAAARCLALCIKLTPDDDAIMSNMYSLLNYITTTNKDIHDGRNAVLIGGGINGSDDSEAPSVQSEMKEFNDEQRHLVSISTISVVARLALEFRVDDVTRLTISMLLQRLRSADPMMEAAITYNLVDLALISSKNSFLDIIRAFSATSRSANPDDTRFSTNTVLAAQTRLAQELELRPEVRSAYFEQLLVLFADKGVAIQNTAMGPHHVKTEDMIDQLVSLILPVDALLSHHDFKPHINPSPEIVKYFRNFWFLCMLFRFTDPSSESGPSSEWSRPALMRIALKTPPLVLENAPDFMTSELEYNSVMRQDYAPSVIGKHRAILGQYIPLRVGELRYLSPGQLVYLLILHDTESMRAAHGLLSSLPLQFINASLTSHSALCACMESMAEKIIRDCLNEVRSQVIEHKMTDKISEELRKLLTLTTNRISKVREVAFKYLDRLITAFPSLMCDEPLVFSILEVLTLMRRACEGENTNEYDPIYEFHSELSNLTLHLGESYQVRNEVLNQLHRNAQNWFTYALARAPIELHSTLQRYLAAQEDVTLPGSYELGATVALQFATSVKPSDRKLPSISGPGLMSPNRANAFATHLAKTERFSGEADGLKLAHMSVTNLEQDAPQKTSQALIDTLKSRMLTVIREIGDKSSHLKVPELKTLLLRCASTIISTVEPQKELTHYLVELPFVVFTPSAVAAGIEAWTWVISERPDIEMALALELDASWAKTIKQRKGLFSSSINSHDPFNDPVTYTATNNDGILANIGAAHKLLHPHVLITQMLLSRFQAARYRSPGLILLVVRLLLRSARSEMSTHPLAREARFSLLLFGFEALKGSYMDAQCETILRRVLYQVAFRWFAVRPMWSVGANRVQIEADVKLMHEFLSLLQADSFRGTHRISSLLTREHNDEQAFQTDLNGVQQLLKLLVDNEIYRLNVWLNPISVASKHLLHSAPTERAAFQAVNLNVIKTAWKIYPSVAVHLAERLKQPTLHAEVGRWVRSNTRDVLDIPEALHWIVGTSSEPNIQRDTKHLLLWDPVTPITAISFFEPQYQSDPIILQYAHRVLKQHPVDLTFFFVPQVVQALRSDALGYVATFIFETAKISQLFCHQIIWNMKANCYKDDLAEVEDPMKPQLDSMTDLVVNALSGEARAFYDREFTFFNDVTSISGKLKPFIKKTKPEKKAKIDEEMAKIKVDPGVYLPSNPDGVVVDIDKKSGRPLQSHAKAPFMATFKVRKERLTIVRDPDSVLGDEGDGEAQMTKYDVWVQAIFKVGDDCRQDVLALQMIAMFKNVFTSVGLPLYLFPYRVTATAPGCGVIDVVPNSTSRDEMGRAKVNDLRDFFIGKYGEEDTIAFQRARLNFIQSMAAYSVACYILQIKDRHNGNIMIDGEGHIIHIDFGFLFDIGPGGVKFEPSSFKLTHEMVLLMGGRQSQGYNLFHQMTVKAFLAIRPHADQIVNTARLMLGTGLPSFKGEPTIQRLRDRFALGLTERQAADYMVGIVKNAYENVRSTVYDEFQRLQNGIPYK